jgi:quercetin dioxygenase-like cupin family protein
MPRVLFTSPACRVVVVDLESGETMGDHRVRERALVQVVTGRVSVETATETVECDAGTLLTFDPSESHTVHALDETRLLLVLAPWPAPDHYTDSETAHVPANAVVDPLPSRDSAPDA